MSEAATADVTVCSTGSSVYFYSQVHVQDSSSLVMSWNFVCIPYFILFSYASHRRSQTSCEVFGAPTLIYFSSYARVCCALELCRYFGCSASQQVVQ